jgi:HEAT repeat protein
VCEGVCLGVSTGARNTGEAGQRFALRSDARPCRRARERRGETSPTKGAKKFAFDRCAMVFTSHRIANARRNSASASLRLWLARTKSAAPLRLMLEGIGRSFCVWPGNAHLSGRSSNYRTLVAERLENLCSRIDEGGLSFTKRNDQHANHYSKLLSFNSHDRLAAAKHFANLRIAGIAPLLILLRDHDISVRDRAYSYFRFSVLSDFRAILLLLANDDPKVRRLAASSLGRLGDDAKEPLEKMIGDQDHLIRSYALYAIAESRKVDHDLFVTALSLVCDPSEYVRKRISDVIAAHGDVDLNLSRNALDILLKDSSRLVVIAAIGAVQCFRPQEAKHFLEALKGLLSSPVPGIRDAVQTVLFTIESSRQ